jgi:exopolysaccharide biosynthesis polyprenyl glycosylphosphotransferase
MAHAAGLGLLHVRPSRHRGPARAAKAALERLAAVVLLLLLAPALLALAYAVRRGSPGPALYRQTRVGRAGVPFTMYKFRTMSADADLYLPELADLNTADGVLFKIRQDPRITRLGGVLRRYSLDELPQLLNVVLGQMSLVGPRPALPDEVERYSHDARRRLAVKPGLTGLWQVSGRSDLSWSDTVRLDLRYVDNWSVGLDLLILCRTVRAVLDHRGAY